MTNLIFFGSDQYAKTTLEVLIASQKLSDISVVTDRPKPVGSERVLTPSEVENLAKTHSLKYIYYPSNQDEMNNFVATLKTWVSETPSVGLCASFDHLLSSEIITVFDGQLFNLHPSLLPQYRNVSPVQYAIALGDQVTGITLFRISEGIDNGATIAQTQETILADDTTTSLTPRLFIKGADLFLRYLGSHLKVSAPTPPWRGRSDPTDTLIFTKRLKRESGYIEWDVLHKLLTDKPVDPTKSTNELLRLRLSKKSNVVGTQILHDLLRALTPWPTLWSIVPSKKSELRITLESVTPTIKLKIAGKAKSISWDDFQTYYL